MIRDLLLTAAATALGTATAHAQTVAERTAPATGQEGGDIVVTGSRSAPRLRTDTSAPVDLFTGESLVVQGSDNLARMLETLSPSFNYVPASSSPSAMGTRPATLRGLTPDQVLVLVNGRRRHAASVINTNNGIGRGTVPVDLNAIPVAAIERIEVLRDGAAAQYGSDAIAGVINIVLREDAGGAYASLQSGVTERGDGGTIVAAARSGVALGEHGFITITSEFRARGRTNAAGVDPRFGRVTQRLGDPFSEDAIVAVNSEVALGETITGYAFATGSGRYTESTPLFRLPTVSPTFYPNGFLPLIKQRTLDIGGAVGIRGTIAGWNWDLSDIFGYNRAKIRVANTVNTSLGAASPTSFYGGSQTYTQNIANLTIDRQFDLLAGTSIAAGVEHRTEWYELGRGEPLSYAGAGAQGFPGYNPLMPVDVRRHAISAFLDAELSLLPGLNLGGAIRFEDYSDFGSRTTWKGSLFWRPLAIAALRGTISSGFRAPSLQQQYFSTVTSQLSSGVLVNVGNFAVSDPVARALGASPLKAERSRSYSAGIVITPAPRLDLSVDIYRIDIDDRITFSESLTGPTVTAILRANNIVNASQVRFFTNAANTRSEGIEATLHWSAGRAATGLIDLSLGYGGFRNELSGLRTNPVLPSLPLLGPISIGVLVDSQPLSKVTANGAFTLGDLHLVANVVNYGPFRAAPLGIVQRFGPETRIDLTLGLAAGPHSRFDIGVLNLTNAFPDEVIGQTDGRLYGEAGGLNFNGREFFARFSIRY